MSKFPYETQTGKPKFLPSVNTPESTNPFGNDDEEPPIFSKRKMLLKIPETCSGDFTHLTVSKNWLVCLLYNPTKFQTVMLRFFLPRAIPPGEICLDKYLAGYKITKLFLDPTGHHTLISLVPKSPGLSADFLYIHGNGPKIRRIEKFKDHEITAVAFNSYMGTEATTGSILLGTSKGIIFETELLQDADKPSYRKQVYDLGLGRPKYPITGLEILRMPNSNKFVIVATAPDCIYTFQETLGSEERSLQNIFTGYVNGTKAHTAIEVKTDLNYSVLRLHGPPNEKYPQTWGWLCGSGIRSGEISSDLSAESLLLDGNEINLDFEQRKHMSSEERRRNDPKTFMLTNYHALIVYPDHVTGICLLNEEVVYEEYFHEQLGKVLDIARDYFTGSVYVYTEKMLFKFIINDENRNVWKIYLGKGLYDLAELHAAENPFDLNTVQISCADAAFEEKNYELAASVYAETDKPFEEVCLKFIDLEDKAPIIHFVQRRMNKLLETDTDEIKTLVIWLVDLYLKQINMPDGSSEDRARWQREYDDFMKAPRVVKCTQENHDEIKNLIMEHADSHNLTQFAIASGDYDEVVSQQLEAENYSAALQTLNKQRDINLFYKYCPILMEQLPHDTVEILMAQGRKLSPVKLIPTLTATHTAKHVEEVLKYLEYAIYNLGETNEVIHNYLLSLYAEHKPKKILSYLENEGHDISLVHYDVSQALNVCLEHDVKVACVFLYCLLRMWPSAVDLAMTFDLQLAKETASKPRDEDMKRKLWLKIAQHDIIGTNDVKKALELLKECDLLRIEDLLPYFSDFEKIDDFKEPICDALKEYNQKIQEIQHEMEECDKQAERVRDDLQNLRDRSIRIEAQSTCNICESLLLIKSFYVFPCGHKFHSDCLSKQIVPLLNSETSRKLTMLKQELDAMMTQMVASAGLTNQDQQKRQNLKQQIEEILASDCLFCGIQIEMIDQPFVEDWDQVNVDWE